MRKILSSVVAIIICSVYLFSQEKDSTFSPRQIDLGTNVAIPLSNGFKDARFNPNFAARALLSTSGTMYNFSMPIELATQSINPELGYIQNFLYYILPERSTFSIRVQPTYASSYFFSEKYPVPSQCTFIIEGDFSFLLKTFATNKNSVFDTRSMTILQSSIKPHFLWKPDKDTYLDMFIGITYINVINGASTFNDVFFIGALPNNLFFDFGFRTNFAKQKIIMDLQFIMVSNRLNQLLLGDGSIYPNLKISVNKDIFTKNE